MNSICPICFQSVMTHQSFYHWLKQDTLLCGDCMSSMQDRHCNVKMNDLSIHVLYEYNDFLENLLFQYKEGQDVILSRMFFHAYASWINRQYRGYTILLMPSSKEKTQERGFHALKEMLEEIQLPKLQPFYKSENRKQSTLSYEERLRISDIMHLEEQVQLPKKNLLLVDDVCTTGSTLKSAYALLPKHTMNVQALVLCATPRFLEEHKTTAFQLCKGRRGIQHDR